MRRGSNRGWWWYRWLHSPHVLAVIFARVDAETFFVVELCLEGGKQKHRGVLKLFLPSFKLLFFPLKRNLLWISNSDETFDFYCWLWNEIIACMFNDIMSLTFETSSTFLIAKTFSFKPNFLSKRKQFSELVSLENLQSFRSLSMKVKLNFEQKVNEKSFIISFIRWCFRWAWKVISQIDFTRVNFQFS